MKKTTAFAAMIKIVMTGRWSVRRDTSPRGIPTQPPASFFFLLLGLLTARFGTRSLASAMAFQSTGFTASINVHKPSANVGWM